MSLFNKQNKEALINPLNLDHPILVQVLGICSALAVTSQLKPAIVMGLAVTVITAFANTIISVIRNTYAYSYCRTACCRCCIGNDCQPDTQGLCLRCKCAAVCICRSDYHQLYPHGTPRSICHDQQAMAIIPRWYRKRSWLRHGAGHCRWNPRVAWPRHPAWHGRHPWFRLRFRVCQQRHDDYACNGVDTFGMRYLGTPCIFLH